MAKKKRQGHYCKICGETKANEKFSGKGHTKHICKSCQSLPADKRSDMMPCPDVDEHSEKNYDDIYDYTDIDTLPIFSEKRKFTELDNEGKMLLRDYVRSKIIEHWEYSSKYPNEQELIEIRKRMMRVLEEECHIILKNDTTLRKFFQDNVISTINKLQKKTEDSPHKK
jgi:hypothetical protein